MLYAVILYFVIGLIFASFLSLQGVSVGTLEYLLYMAVWPFLLPIILLLALLFTITKWRGDGLVETFDD
jgi:hypothetical protein